MKKIILITLIVVLNLLIEIEMEILFIVAIVSKILGVWKKDLMK